MSNKQDIKSFEIKSPIMIELYDQLESYAIHNRPCVLFGPSGSGKEFAARYYFEKWKNAKNGTGKFIAVNCATLSENTAASHLFAVQ